MKSFPIVAGLTLFINFILVAGESADKKEVLNAFTEVYDMMYAIRDDHAAQIKELMEQDLEKTKKIEHLELRIQELQKLNAPASCAEMWKQGIERDQYVFLDSDGVNHGEKPVQAFCTYPSNDDSFGEEKRINITYCEGPNCFQSDFQIDSSARNQIQNVIEASTTCSQNWTFNCISAPLKQPVSIGYVSLFSLSISEKLIHSGKFIWANPKISSSFSPIFPSFVYLVSTKPMAKFRGHWVEHKAKF